MIKVKENKEVKPIKEKKRSPHFVDNKAFLQSMIEYGVGIRRAKRLKVSEPAVPEYVGECLLKIAEHLRYKKEFIGFINSPFNHDMVGDGIINCLQYIKNFNPKKSKNPFAYFTQIMFYAFIRRIQQEKKQTVIKYRAIQNSPFFQDLTQQAGDDAAYNNGYIQFIKKNMSDMVDDYEQKKKDKQAKIKAKKVGKPPEVLRLTKFNRI